MNIKTKSSKIHRLAYEFICNGKPAFYTRCGRTIITATATLTPEQANCQSTGCKESK